MLVDVEALQHRLRTFAQERNWEQFHTPRNLTMALAGEVGELLAVLQWRTDDELENPEVRAEFEDEIADVMIYLARLADIAGVDLSAAVEGKMARNVRRFPPSL